MHILQDLDGVTTARIVTEGPDLCLTLSAPSGFLHDHYFPAESLTLTSTAAIRELHRVLGIALANLPPKGVQE